MALKRKLCFRNPFLIFTITWMCTTESLGQIPVCRDEAVYHYGSNSCLLVTISSVSVYNARAVCSLHQGGKYHNSSGELVRADKSLEGFLRDYLKFVRIPKAVVSMEHNGFLPQNFSGLTTKIICGDRGQFILENMTVMSLPDPNGTPVYWEPVTCGYIGPAVCQVRSAGPASKKSRCPANLTLDSVSENNVILNMIPGVNKGQVKAIFIADKSCTTPSHCGQHKMTYDKMFLVRPTTRKYTQLEYSTRYSARIMIDDYDGELPFDCNMTVEFTTGEAPNGDENNCKSEVIGLSVILACSGCAACALAIYYCGLCRSTKLDNTGLPPSLLMSQLGRGTTQECAASDYNGKPQTIGNAYLDSCDDTSNIAPNVWKGSNTVHAMGHDSDIGDYTNVPVASLNYDVADYETDDHLYEI